MVKTSFCMIFEILAILVLWFSGVVFFRGCVHVAEKPVSFSTPPGQFAFAPDTVILQDGQSLQLLEDIAVQGRIPFNGDELYTGKVGIKKGTMIVKPKVEGPIQSTPIPPEAVPMTREEKGKKFQAIAAQ